MKEKRYILNSVYKMQYDNDIELIADMSGDNVKDKELFFDPEEKYTTKVYDKDWEFNYLEPTHYDEFDDIKFICDLHSWIKSRPRRIMTYPISKRMKDVLDQFNLYPNKFYPAKVLFNKKLHEYYVWQFFLYSMDKFTNFEHSTFCEWGSRKKAENDIIKATSEDELDDISMNKDWRYISFDKAVMKPEFKNMDCVRLPFPLGIVISERLKNALEAVQPALTGFEIIECPVEFEYLE